MALRLLKALTHWYVIQLVGVDLSDTLVSALFITILIVAVDVAASL